MKPNSPTRQSMRILFSLDMASRHLKYQWDDYKGVDVKGKVLLMLGERTAFRRSQFL